MAKCTLGIILAPNGDGSSQLQHSIIKAKELVGRLRNASLNQQAKWVAVQPIIEPAVLYPMINTLYNGSDFSAVESTISQA